MCLLLLAKVQHVWEANQSLLAKFSSRESDGKFLYIDSMTKGSFIRMRGFKRLYRGLAWSQEQTGPDIKRQGKSDQKQITKKEFKNIYFLTRMSSIFIFEIFSNIYFPIMCQVWLYAFDPHPSVCLGVLIGWQERQGYKFYQFIATIWLPFILLLLGKGNANI